MSLQSHLAGREAIVEGGGRSQTAAVLLRFLSPMKIGSLRLTLPSGEQLHYRGERAGVAAELTLNRWRGLRRLVSGGDIGFAKAYIDGDWSTPDLVALLEMVSSNGSDIIERMSGNVAFRVVNWLSHLIRANTRAGSRRNIVQHYDLGNEFYGLWLDSSMQYSSAIYAAPERTLEEAQLEKGRQILEMLDLFPDASVLEIGCGWGALAMAMADEGKARVTGITLSPSQLAFARHAVERTPLADKIDLRLDDYRDIGGRYDRIVSIEMIEAVGHKYWPSYFGVLSERLKPGGVAVLQAITIAEERFEGYRAQPDFIQRYIFPGGFLPTKSAIAAAAAASGLRVVETRAFGASYALTLADWRRRFLAAWPKIETLGFDESFKRLWEYYLCYCEAGFKTGVVDVGLYSLTHATTRSD